MRLIFQRRCLGRPAFCWAFRMGVDSMYIMSIMILSLNRQFSAPNDTLNLEVEEFLRRRMEKLAMQAVKLRSGEENLMNCSHGNVSMPAFSAMHWNEPFIYVDVMTVFVSDDRTFCETIKNSIGGEFFTVDDIKTEKCGVINPRESKEPSANRKRLRDGRSKLPWSQKWDNAWLSSRLPITDRGAPMSTRKLGGRAVLASFTR
eukprot:IDg23188t1